MSTIARVAATLLALSFLGCSSGLLALSCYLFSTSLGGSCLLLSFGGLSLLLSLLGSTWLLSSLRVLSFLKILQELLSVLSADLVSSLAYFLNLSTFLNFLKSDDELLVVSFWVLDVDAFPKSLSGGSFSISHCDQGLLNHFKV